MKTYKVCYFNDYYDYLYDDKPLDWVGWRTVKAIDEADAVKKAFGCLESYEGDFPREIQHEQRDLFVVSAKGEPEKLVKVKTWAKIEITYEVEGMKEFYRKDKELNTKLARRSFLDVNLETGEGL